MLHIYYGNGKGKTTAAIGLAIRQLGAGKKVVFAQFLKDGKSSEIAILKKLGVEVLHTMMPQQFVKDMNEHENKIVSESVYQVWRQAITTTCDCLVLDELLDCLQLSLLEEEMVLEQLKQWKDIEIVLTGRNPSDKLVLLGDYVMEVKVHKHPYQKGIKARKGVEF